MSNPDARFDKIALDIARQIEAMPKDWSDTRRMAHAQVLIIEALLAVTTPEIETHD